MKPVVKIVLVLLLMVAVILYTIYNYLAGNSEFSTFLAAMAFMGLLVVSMLNQLIQELKKK